MTSPDLKPCPACGKDARLIGSSVECADVSVCHLIGPSDDPDGAKWDALPRRGTGKEMEELRAAADSWRQDFADDHVSFAALHVRRAIDAVLAATPRVETAPSGDVALLTKERDEALNKAAAFEDKIKDLVGANVEALANLHRKRQQIAALKDLVREFARDGGDEK